MTLRASALRMMFGRRLVVDDVSVSVERGEIVGLLGPNGAGKSTTFGILTGKLHANAGSAFIDGRDVTRMSMPARARAGLGYLPQERSIYRRLSVEDNLLLPLEHRSLTAARERELLTAAVRDLALEPIAKQLGAQLSGGQQRRVEVARALVTEPRYLLLDEPFSGIDPLTVADLQHIFTRLRSSGYGMLITDHNVRDTLEITDRSYVIDAGRIAAQGSPVELLANETARRVFFGSSFHL